jgi:hypothetical protein
MIRLLRLLCGEAPRYHPARKPAPGAKREPAKAGGDYRAVSLAPNIECGSAAKTVAGRRYLLREAPRLPLPDCTMPTKCSCQYRKHADRRDGDRRLFGTLESGRWFPGTERRKGGRRRLTGS